MDKKLILKYVKSFFFYFIVGYLVLYISLQVISPKTTIKVLQTKPFVVETSSMSPIIEINDMVVARNFNIEKLEIGDIIVFTTDIDPWLNNGSETVTHYIHDIYEEEGVRKYKTIRNNGLLPDSWVLEDEDILGLYWFHIPKVGMVQRFFQSPFGIATIAVNAIIIGVIIYLVKTDKKNKIEEVKA